MDEDSKRKAIQKYFSGSAGWAILLLVLGIIGIMVSVAAESTEGAVVSGVFLIIGIVGIVVSESGRPSDNQIDDWLESDRQDLITRSKVKLGVDESQVVSDPYELFIWLWLGIEDTEGIPDADVKYKRGKVHCKYPHFYYDVVRHSAWRFQVFYPTEHYLASYGCKFDFLRGKFVNERTQEIYYKDITILETRTEDTIDLKRKGLKESHYERFTLKVSSGDAVSVYIPSEYLITQELKDNVSEIPSTRCEKMVQSMRKMIQPKKA